MYALGIFLMCDLYLQLIFLGGDFHLLLANRVPKLTSKSVDMFIFYGTGSPDCQFDTFLIIVSKDEDVPIWRLTLNLSRYYEIVFLLKLFFLLYL